MMSFSTRASEFVIATSSSSAASSDSDSSSQLETIGSTNCGTVYYIDRLNTAYTKCCEKINKYELRSTALIKRIKGLRRAIGASIVPPPQIPSFEEDKVPATFDRKLVGEQSYAEVVSKPIVPKVCNQLDDNIPIVKSNFYLINNLQKEININNWRIAKQLDRKRKLNKLILNQVSHSSVYNPTVVPIDTELNSNNNDNVYTPFPALPTSTKNQKNRKSRASINDSILCDHRDRSIPKDRPINYSLLIKLRLKIRAFRYTITSKYIDYLLYYKFKLLSYPVYPQMDAHGEASTFNNPDKKLNTVIDSQRETSIGASTPIIYPEWSALVTSDHFSQYPTSTNRWTKYKTLKWTNNTVTTPSISIPSDLIKELKSTPIFVPFRNNRYWKGDFEFKFVLNSNKFQQGALQIGFVYCSGLEQDFEVYRDNIYSGSQTNHCILNAGSSNEGTLLIPFKYFNPVITTNPTENVDYCKIFIRVLNSLVCTSNSYNSCEITVFVNLDNAYFTGSIDYTLINEPQMFHLLRALVKTSEFGLNQLDPDANRDNPPTYQLPNSVVISNASSWCSGNNDVDSVQHMRLDPTGQTPHPNLQHDELKTYNITRIFGLVNTFEWSFNDHQGVQLMNIEAAPMSNLKTYVNKLVEIDKKSFQLYHLPPLAVISNLYAYWRGTIELRLDFISTSFHTGSLLVAYLPGIKNSVSIDQARSSNYVVCSLQERQSYTIRIPYIANSAAWPRKYNKSYKIHNSLEVNPPGSIQIFVLNPLIPLDNVYNKIYVNYYIRGGPDFEVMVPIQPNISTPYNLNFKDDDFNNLPLSNSDGTSTKFNFVISKARDIQNNFVTLTYTNYPTEAVQAYESLRDGYIVSKRQKNTDLNVYVPQKTGIFKFYLQSSLPVPFRINKYDSPDSVSIVNIKFFVLYNELCSNVGMTTLWPCSDEASAHTYAKSEQSWSDLVKCILYAKSSKYNQEISVNINSLTKIFIHKPNTYEDFAIVQNEERSLASNYLDMTQSLPSTQFGLNLFGEQFSDLKDYCRRYQYYTNISYQTNDIINKKHALAIVPLVPQGLVNSVIYNDEKVNHIVSRCKDGFIPIISSGYRFYRGGLRIRIVSDTRRNINLWVQHRPEMLLKYLQTHILDQDNQSLSDYFNHSYSFIIQNLELNNVVSVEIPWYSKNMLGCSFLPKVQSLPNDINAQKQTAFSLGSLVLGVDCSSTELKDNLNLDIYYSIADDFHFNTFQGYPALLTLDQIPNTYQAYPQMGLFTKAVENQPIIKKYDALADTITEKIDNFSKVLSEIPDMINGYFSDSDTTFRLILSNIFFEIVHLLVNPTVKTLIVTVLSLFTRIGIVVGEATLRLYKLFKTLFKKLQWKSDSKVSEAPPDEPIPSCSNYVADPQSDSEIADTTAGIVAIFWAGINTLLNANFKSCDKIKDYCGVLMESISKGTLQANNIFRFIKNCFSVLELCYKGVVNKIYASYNKYTRLQIEEDTIQEWLELCDQLLLPINQNLVQNDLEWREAVYGAARYGHLYLTKSANVLTPRVDVYIRKIYDKIIALRDSLQNEKLFPSLRMEAFGLWIDGEPGIGKSSMVTRLTTDLLHSVNYKGGSNLIFNVTPLDKYWNNCNHQPVIAIDDAFAITTPECIQNQLWTYFTVMSPVPLIPPMAEIKDKKMHYNPEIMITCSNNPFPKMAGLAVEKALYRRRHHLIKAELVNNNCKVYPYGCSDIQLKNFEHLQFRFAISPEDVNTKYSSPMTYPQLIENLITSFRVFKQRTAYSYEERKRLQFSMMTNSEAKKLPPNTKITAFLQEFDKFNKNRLKEIRNEHDRLSDTYQLIEAIQNNPDFTLKLKVDIPKLNKPPPTIEEMAANVQETSNEALLPQMEVELLDADFDNPLPTEEEKKFYQGIADEYKDYERMKAKKALDHPIPGLAAFEAALDKEFINPMENMLRYRLRFSPVAAIFTHYHAKDYKSHISNPVVRGMVAYNKQHPNHMFNSFHGIVPQFCIHHLIKDCKLLKQESLMGNVFPVFKVPVKCDMITNKLVYDPLGSNYIDIVDTPCESPVCVVLSAREWSDIVTAWAKQNVVYCPWIITDTSCPALMVAVKSMTANRRLIHKIQNWVQKTVKFCVWDVIYRSAHSIGSIFSNIGMFLSGFAAMLGVLGVFKTFGKPRPQLISSGDTTTKRTLDIRNIIYGTPQNGSQHASNMISLITKRIYQNTVYIRFEDPSTNKFSNMKCLVIKDRFMIILKHYEEFILANKTQHSKIHLVWADCGMLPFDIENAKINWYKNSNIGLTYLSRAYASRRSLLPFITSSDNFVGEAHANCHVIDCSLESLKQYHETVSLIQNLTIAPTGYSKSLIMPNAYAYKTNYAGMCGSVLINAESAHPIIGIHVAGANRKGFSEPICAAMFKGFIDNWASSTPEDWRTLPTKMIPVDEQKMYLSGTHTYLGDIDPNLGKYEMGITSIVPSTIAGVYPVLTEPGPLSPRDPRINKAFSPLISGCEKNCNPTIDFNSEDLNLAYNDLNNLILANCKPLRVTVNHLTELQAINGVPDIPEYAPIVWNTSEGFYLSRFRPKGATDKRWLFNFDSEGKAISVHPNLREILDSKQSDRENNIVPLTIHDDCLKDARLPLNKITVPGKVRVFSISPVDFTIQFRQYFLDFIASYTRARFNCEHAIGINVHGPEWTTLAHLMADKKVITGDYSGFGPTLNSEVVSKAFLIVNNWYNAHNCSKEDNNIRHIMSLELINAKHLMGTYLYQVSCGLPSGNPATVIFNSLVNSLYLRCAWLDIMRDTVHKSLYSQRKLMKIITYGDDLIASIDDSVVHKFNNNSLSHFFKKHNIIFTDAAKTNVDVAPYLELDNATFLKHSFKKHPKRDNVYLASLDEQSITECANWIRKSPDPKQATYDNCVQGTMLAYGHGPTYYQEYVDTIAKAWFEEYHEEFLVRTWDDLDRMFLDEGYFFHF
nr:TPA_asm: polyprotein [Iflavirus aphis]